ncbi:uncharacterized protein [Diadema antillarum]|uniref:uncharacterized protein n=1 Tax=Diadema antillarum TaxID=105358 RepID=UPI003A84FD08
MAPSNITVTARTLRQFVPVCRGATSAHYLGHGLTVARSMSTHSLTKHCEPPEFGRSLREREFFIPVDLAYVNHGSYGSVPKSLLKIQQRMLEEMESNPELWYRFKALDLYKNAAKQVADFVAAQPENLLLIENATTATNSILQSFHFEAGDQILMTNHTYMSVEQTVQILTSRRPDIDVVQIHIPFKTTTEEILERHVTALNENPRIRLALIDHIPCTSAILFPIRELVSMCRERGVISAVDGAHGPGQVSLRLEDLGADFYYGRQMSDVGLVNGGHHHWLRTAVSSLYTFSEDLHKRFHYTGTKDYIPFYMAGHAIDYLSYLGGLERITAYNSELTIWAAEMLADAWQTNYIKLEGRVRAPFMCLVTLPKTPRLAQFWHPTGLREICREIAKEGVVVAVTRDEKEKYLRLNAQVYNFKEEFYALRDAVIKVLGAKV